MAHTNNNLVSLAWRERSLVFVADRMASTNHARTAWMGYAKTLAGTRETGRIMVAPLEEGGEVIVWCKLGLGHLPVIATIGIGDDCPALAADLHPTQARAYLDAVGADWPTSAPAEEGIRRLLLAAMNA
jgi:hypothetical protein